MKFNPVYRRRLALTGFIVILLSVSVILPMVVRRPPLFTKASFERIQEGMSEAQVDEIIGCPPGDYTTVPMERDLTCAGSYGSETISFWEGDEGSIVVGIDPTDGVLWKHFLEPIRREVTVVELVQWRFKRWWGRVWPTSVPDEG